MAKAAERPPASEQGRPPAGGRPRPAGGWRELLVFRGRPDASVQLYVAIATFGAILLLWLAITEAGLLAPQFLPSPLDVLNALRELFLEAGFTFDILISIYRVWMAFALAALMAIPLGILMSSFRIVGSVTEPVVDFIRYLPVPALVPLTIIWFGIGELSKIVLLWMGTFFQLVLLIADDARRVPREYVETGRTLGAGSSQIMRDILVPAMLPSMVDNLRITLGWCWTYLVIAEIVAANSGIGYVIWAAKRYVQTDKVFAGILAIGIIGLATDQAIRALHRRLFPYLR
jgi:NitT/TauT family transport system permease protein